MSLLCDSSFKSPDSLMSRMAKRAKKVLEKHAPGIVKEVEKSLKKGKMTSKAKKILKKITGEEKTPQLVF